MNEYEIRFNERRGASGKLGEKQRIKADSYRRYDGDYTFVTEKNVVIADVPRDGVLSIVLVPPKG